jgi:hypothetical protein
MHSLIQTGHLLLKSISDVVGAGESIVYTPSLTGEYFVVVKRAREDIGGGQLL